MPMPRKYSSAAERQSAYRQRQKSKCGTPVNAALLGSVYRRWEGMRRQALMILEQAAGEMELYFEGRSEAWCDSDRGEAFVEMMESVKDIAEALKEVPSHLPQA
jgi:hypothetical protein